jgi:Flp pilus assembly pilin Flp
MLRKFASNLLRDQKGNNLIAYALVLGAIAIAGATYLSRVSNGLKAGLNHQATKIAQTAGTYKAPASAKPATPAGGSGKSGKSSK